MLKSMRKAFNLKRAARRHGMTVIEYRAALAASTTRRAKRVAMRDLGYHYAGK